MESQVILITGALTGIGRATALEAARRRPSPDRLRPQCRDRRGIGEEIRELGAEAAFIRADVRDDEQVRDLVDGAVARFGRLDLAVNSRRHRRQPGPMAAQTVESYARHASTPTCSARC